MSPEERALVDATRAAWMAAKDLPQRLCGCGCGMTVTHDPGGAEPRFLAQACSAAPALCGLADRQEAELAAKDARIAELEAALARRPT